MKVLYTLIAGLCLSVTATAQVDTGSTTPTPAAVTADSTAPDKKARSSKWFDYSKNIVKVNVSSIALNNYALYYERMLTRKISATAGFRFMPNSKLTETPLGKQALDLLDEDGEDLKTLSASNNTITAGIRFYTGKRAGAKGLYAEIYGRYGEFKLDYDYSFTTDGKEYDVAIKGRAKGFGGGILFGGQFMIAKKLVIDLYIVGAHYGKLTGNIDGLSDLTAMSAEDKQSMQDDINDIIPEISGKKILKAEVSDTGIKGKLDGPFLGARGLGLSIGWSF